MLLSRNDILIIIAAIAIYHAIIFSGLTAIVLYAYRRGFHDRKLIPTVESIVTKILDCLLGDREKKKEDNIGEFSC